MGCRFGVWGIDVYYFRDVIEIVMLYRDMGSQERNLRAVRGRMSPQVPVTVLLFYQGEKELVINMQQGFES